MRDLGCSNSVAVYEEEAMTAEEFWRILFGEEAYSFAEWKRRGFPECPITESRFREALERINKKGII